MVKFYVLKADFLFGLKEGWWKKVREFESQPKDDLLVEFDTKEGKKLKARLIRVKLEDGQQQIFCTSVMSKKFSPQDFSDLYHNRWGVEETYKTLKNWVELENFSGKTALAI